MLKVVYDVDDTLWGLNDFITKLHGIDIRKIKRYKTIENDELTEEEKRLIIGSYGDPDIFKQLLFYEGCERVFDLQVFQMADIWISSASLNDAIRDIKRERLKELPNIDMGHVVLTSGSDPFQGRVPGDILVDDCVKNILDHDFTYNIMLDKTYNHSEEDAQAIIDSGKNVIRVFSLDEAIDKVENIVMVHKARRMK